MFHIRNTFSISMCTTAWLNTWFWLNHRIRVMYVFSLCLWVTGYSGGKQARPCSDPITQPSSITSTFYIILHNGSARPDIFLTFNNTEESLLVHPLPLLMRLRVLKWFQIIKTRGHGCIEKGTPLTFNCPFHVPFFTVKQVFPPVSLVWLFPCFVKNAGRFKSFSS